MLPLEVKLLIEKFGPCDIIDKEDKIPANFNPHLKPTLGACVIIRDRDDKLVLIRQSSDRLDLDSKYWFFVCGKKEPGESLEETGIREAREEIDCEVKIKGVHHIGHHFVYLDGDKHSIYYGAALVADLISGKPKVNSKEVAEVNTFTCLPDNFYPRHRKYYSDMC